MKTIYTLICDNCQEENPLYKSTCTNCNYYLRSSEVNIDLWKTIWNLFESPTSTIKNIIYSKHKNFVIFLLVLFSLKINLINIVINSAFANNSLLRPNYSNLLLGTIIVLLSTLIFVKVATIVFNSPKKRTRYKDNVALLSYSFAPSILTLFVLLPIEYGIFGLNWFDYNPSPIIIKENTAYILLFIELVMILWSFFLLWRSFFIQTNSIIKSIGSLLFVILTLFITLNLIFNIYFSSLT